MLDKALIDAERERLPERVFAQEYAGDFVEGAGQVFRYVRDAATGDWQAPVPGKRYVAGLDLAKIADFSVLAIMNQERQVVFVDRFNRLDWELQVTRVRAATDRYNRASILVDSTGAGEPIYESLRKAGLRVQPYGFTAKSKSDLINNLSLMLEKRQIVLPKYELCPELIDELEAYEYSVTEAGTIRTNAPGGQHDDAVVSLCLAAWLLRRDPAPLRAVWV
jgi:phage FluMu gp28-like protein